MPSGETHTKFNIVPTTISVVGAIYFGDSWLYIGLPIGSILGILVTPDLDLEQNISINLIKDFNGVLGFLWKAYWFPYAKIANHRGASHTPFFSTLFRFVYLFWWMFFFPEWWQFLTFVFWGLFLSDLFHIIMDAFF